MLYAFGLFYMQDRKSFPFQKSVLVTAKTVAQWCTHFRARLLAPSKKDIAQERQGVLPTDLLEKEAFVAELVQWIFANSLFDDLFYLLMDNEPIQQANKVAKFAYYDTYHSWLLNLTDSEFGLLQEAWVTNGLPANLFYPEQETVCVPYPGNSLKAKVLRWLGVQTCFTPMQWQKYQEVAGQTALPPDAALLRSTVRVKHVPLGVFC